jgi:hypothetical protein
MIIAKYLVEKNKTYFENFKLKYNKYGGYKMIIDVTGPKFGMKQN